MNLDFYLNTLTDGEPIFLDEYDCKNKDYIRQKFKKYTDEGILIRVQNGVYYKSYKTILGTKGKMSIEKFINKAYLNCFNDGYYTGLTLANKYGFTSQNPSNIELTSNKATTKQRKIKIDGYTLIVYKPVSKINKNNKSALQFLDLMVDINKYCELNDEEYRNKLKEFIKETNVNFYYVKKYISKYPLVVYKNIYEGGLMNELV